VESIQKVSLFILNALKGKKSYERVKILIFKANIKYFKKELKFKMGFNSNKLLKHHQKKDHKNGKR
jgi:hypothetical protein